MGKCSICSNEVMFGKKISGGTICNDCYEKIPKVFRSMLLMYTVQDLNMIMEIKKDKNKFQPTASYGGLQIDELHGLFGVDYKGEITIFNCLDLDEIGLYCTKPSADRNNSVHCDVEFACKFRSSTLSIRTTLKSHVNCRSHKKDGTHLEWDEPGDLSLFRNMFMQMYDSARNKYNRSVNNNLISKQDIDRLKAEALFLIDGQYSDRELDEKRNLLLSVFKDEKERNKINYAYSILIEE